MNLEKPHDIIPEEVLRRLPKAEQGKYQRITVQEKAALSSMTEGQRSSWLDLRSYDGFDAHRIRKAQAKRDRKAKKRT